MGRKYEELITLIIKKTKEGKITWSHNASERTYSVELTAINRTITIWHRDESQFSMQYNEPIYRLSITDEKGNEIDKIAVDKETDCFYKLLSDLHTSAYNSYNKVEETLNNIIRTIREL